MGCVDRCKAALSESGWQENEKTRQDEPAGYCMHCQKQADCRHCATRKNNYR